MQLTPGRRAAFEQVMLATLDEDAALAVQPRAAPYAPNAGFPSLFLIDRVLTPTSRRTDCPAAWQNIQVAPTMDAFV